VSGHRRQSSGGAQAPRIGRAAERRRRSWVSALWRAWGGSA